MGIARQPALPAPAASPPAAAPSPAAPPLRAQSDAVAPLDRVIAEHLAHVLRLTGGRIDGPHGAARLLRVNASTLRAKLRKHGLLPADYRRPSKQPR